MTLGPMHGAQEHDERYSAMARILMVLTSHDRLGDTDRSTGFWLEELAAPYYVFTGAGHDVVLASPKGGQAPVDPASTSPEAQTEASRRFTEDPQAQQALATTTRLSEVRPEQFDAVFYPGGHGPLWDLVDDPDSQQLLREAFAAEQPLGLVCHAPGILARATSADEKLLVEGRKVTGFTNGEEEAAGLTTVVPFLVEDALKESGAQYAKGADGQSHVVRDGQLVTGQNPASSEAAARELLGLINA